MYHLLSYSVYQDLSFFGDDPAETFRSIGCDGLELLTGYQDVDPAFFRYSKAVHLPYAPNWLAGWEGRPDNMDDDQMLFYMYGRDREEVVSNIRRSIEFAAPSNPAYGVFHAGNADTPELIHRRYTRPDGYVLKEFCEMMNTVVSSFPREEPPFRILFENLWWPGLRLLDDSGFRYLDSHLEFDDWGICLDTGHMMSCLPVRSQLQGIEALLKVFDGYPQDLIDAIDDVHFHWSASAEYRETFEEQEPVEDMSEFLRMANSHVGKIDRHLPFSDSRCAELIEVLNPRYVTHEMPGSELGVIEDFRKQRSLLP